MDNVSQIHEYVEKIYEDINHNTNTLEIITMMLEQKLEMIYWLKESKN
jgi:hypothetical protein